MTIQAILWAATMAVTAAANGPVGKAAHCPLMRAPVCSLLPDGTRANFVNSCVGGRKHAKVLHEGDCAAPGKEPAMCNMLFQPVCGTDPATGSEKTYPNLCHAEVANAKILHDGKCGGKADLPG
jgi:hypothetical protein